MTNASVEARLAALESQYADAMRTITDLQARDALKTQFLSNISHDLRTPLTAIITHAEIIRDGILGAVTPRQHESISGIINGGRQLLDMVGEILTYARGAADQLTLAIVEFPMAQVVAQVVELNEALIAKKGLSLSVKIDEHLPSVQGDRERVAHILGNLLGNAIDFTSAGGRVWINVSRNAKARGEVMLVEVGDTGIGIAHEHHELIFREFAQVDSSPSRRHHGTGLGLTIARKLVELHDGDIWVESDVGAGSRFYFSIPYSQPATVA